jgi:hypothetical protein
MEPQNIFELIKAPATVLHVVSVVLGMGGALMSDILFSFFGKDKKLNPTELSTLEILSKVVLYSLVIIIASGFLIFLSDVDKYLNSAKFLAKMTIVVVLLVNGYVLNKYVWPHLLNKAFFTLKRERSVRQLAFVCGAISVISWLVVCGLGVLDRLPMSYSLVMSLYTVGLLFGGMMSLVIEKKELN